ncbi:translation initiation factor eIF-1A [Candidatus Woesearchaeota archaeon]|jgi:translation initiation factor 1A|nr:translation initiation factor eIF-1A [Candidatus Woesearchaeota archaeon]MBT6518771.1 translation initiation factor eIF-1A [Candidatus Woesearchaeota archaeon]MBT7366879.1 translation initiation factor eIF-1A [Candidatus Woesearchaeota archaeon]
MSKKEQAKRDAARQAAEEEIRRIRLPKGEETLGIVDQRVGGSRMFVRCLDGKQRVCRIPGRLKKRLWVRERDIVIIEPWEFGGDEKGDVILKYRPNQVSWLRKNGYLRTLEEADEF